MKKNEEEILPLEQDEKRQERETNARVQEIIDELLKKNEEKREDMDDERSQEEFPNYYKRLYVLTSKEKREDPDNERSQEEFPQKRHSSLFTKKKREDQDEERSQEEFPTYEQKRHLFMTSKEKRDDPDYDRSQEDFPSYVYKRYHDEDVKKEKQIWKPHKYHYKRYDDSSNEDFAELNSQEKRFEDERAKQYWNPIQRYHHKKHHKDDGDSSDEDMESEEKEKKVLWTRGSEEGSEESEEKEKRVWKPSYNNHHMKLFNKQGKLETENEANLHHSLETSNRRSPEEEEEALIAQELNENKHHYDSHEEQKRHHSDAEEKKQEKEAELRYLTKKRNELEERLLKEGEVYDKRNPWIYRGYYHPAWYKRSTEEDEGPVGPSQKLEELANALRYKMGLLSEKESSEGEKAYLHQRALTPEEVNLLVKNRMNSWKEYEYPYCTIVFLSAVTVQ